MKKAFSLFKKKYLPKIIFFAVLFTICVLPVASQSAGNENFPKGSTQGTTQMSSSITGLDFPNITFSATAPRTGKQVAFSVQLLLLLTVLTLAPSLLILVTCFLRFSIVLDFIKRALSLQQVPPTAVLNGIALFMTLFVMWPTFTTIYDKSFRPLSNGEIGLEEAYREAEEPIRFFMEKQMDGDNSYVTMFMSMAKMQRPRNWSDVPTYVIIPSYILHELT